jgi:hypothetical protein
MTLQLRDVARQQPSKAVTKAVLAIQRAQISSSKRKMELRGGRWMDTPVESAEQGQERLTPRIGVYQQAPQSLPTGHCGQSESESLGEIFTGEFDLGRDEST